MKPSVTHVWDNLDEIIDQQIKRIKVLERALEDLHKEFLSSSIVFYDRGLEKRIKKAEQEIENEKV